MLAEEKLSAVKSHVLATLATVEDFGGLKVHTDGDYVAAIGDIRYLIIFDANDPSFVKIVCNASLPAEGSAYDMAVVDVALNRSNRQCKGVKLTRSESFDEDGDFIVTASVDMLLNKAEDMSPSMFERYISMIKCGLVVLTGKISGIEADKEVKEELASVH